MMKKEKDKKKKKKKKKDENEEQEVRKKFVKFFKSIKWFNKKYKWRFFYMSDGQFKQYIVWSVTLYSVQRLGHYDGMSNNDWKHLRRGYGEGWSV